MAVFFANLIFTSDRANNVFYRSDELKLKKEQIQGRLFKMQSDTRIRAFHISSKDSNVMVAVGRRKHDSTVREPSSMIIVHHCWENGGTKRQRVLRFKSILLRSSVKCNINKEEDEVGPHTSGPCNSCFSRTDNKPARSRSSNIGVGFIRRRISRTCSFTRN